MIVVARMIAIESLSAVPESVKLCVNCPVIPCPFVELIACSTSSPITSSTVWLSVALFPVAVAVILTFPFFW